MADVRFGGSKSGATSGRPRSSTTMVRRQLGRRLRALREASGRTRADVVLTKLMSHGKLELIEYGRSVVRPGDVYELCTLYGASAEVTDALRELAAATTQEGWWVGFGGVDKPFRTFLDLESAARAIHVFQPQLIYGLLQIEEYARAVERGSDPGLGEEAVELNVRLRMARQRALFSPDRSVGVHVVLGEAALRTGVVEPTVMRRQYDRLYELSGGGSVDLRILPFRAGAHPGLLGAFTILEFEDSEDPAVVYVQSYEAARYNDQKVLVDQYRRIYRAVRDRSVLLEEFPL